MHKQPGESPLLDQLESLIKDRFGSYLIVASDGEDVYVLNSNHTAALGLARYAQELALRELFGEGAP